MRISFAFSLASLGAALIISIPSSLLAKERNAPAASSPRLEYRTDGRWDDANGRNDHVSQNGTRDPYRGRWIGTWYGADGRTYTGQYEGDFRQNGEFRSTTPDPAYIGSGQTVNGWYYPAPTVTTTITEYAPAR